jgi:hypothetical protein
MNEHIVLPHQRINVRRRPVFLRNWWLKIAGECCESVTVTGTKGLLKGSFRYWIRRNRLGLPFGYNPPLSHLSGFTISPILDLQEQCGVIDELIAQLPRGTSFHFVFDSIGQNAEHIRRSFQKAGFTHQTHKSYLRPPGDPDVLSGIRSGVHRRRINSASRRLHIEEINANQFLMLYANNLRAARKKIHWPIEVAGKLIEEGVRRKQMYIIAVRKKWAHEYDGAIACICDPVGERMYYWMSTRSHSNGENKPHRDTQKVLVKKAMEYAQSRNWEFDADGATTKGAEEFQRDSLGLNVWEERDVFMRLTRAARAYEDWRPSLARMVASLNPSMPGFILWRLTTFWRDEDRVQETLPTEM